jgi:hypothetical protein
VRAPSVEKSVDSKDICHEELEQVVEYHMEFLLGDFSAKLERKVIFKQTTGIESLHQDSNDSATRKI